MNWNAAHTLFCLIPLLFASCSDAPPVEQQEESMAGFDQLDAILRAYMAYTTKKDSPPTSAEDITEFFEDGVDTTKVFQSSRDNQPYVVHWGIDPRKQSGPRPLVLGYEQQGKNENRLVMTAFGVMEMNRAQFSAAKFPDGKRPTLKSE